MNISAHFHVEAIEEGFVVSHKESARKVWVRYRFDIVRQIERFLHDDVVKRVEEQAAAEPGADRLLADDPMQCEGI